MKNATLQNLIEKLKSSPRVKGVFSTGTTATGLTPSSDIDLIIILDKNDEDIKSIYTTIENRFADIFFFDIDFLSKLRDKGEVKGNNFGGMFFSWLAKGKIEYDPENILLDFKNKIDGNLPIQKITDSEKREFWIKTNYNFICNKRYYNSTNELYHKALEFRLLYSIIELVTAYFSFRGIPWRGEKDAVKYFEDNDQDFFFIFQEYSKSNSLEQKMKYYEALFNKIFFGEHQKWEDGFVIPISNNRNVDDKKLDDFWDDLVK